MQKYAMHGPRIGAVRGESLRPEPSVTPGAASGPQSRTHGEEKALQEAQRRQRHTLTRQIRHAQARVSAADRQCRTRRLILIGSYIDSVSQGDPTSMTKLMKGLDGFLERDQDRAFFDLPPRPKDA